MERFLALICLFIGLHISAAKQPNFIVIFCDEKLKSTVGEQLHV